MLFLKTNLWIANIQHVLSSDSFYGKQLWKSYINVSSLFQAEHEFEGGPGMVDGKYKRRWFKAVYDEGEKKLLGLLECLTDFLGCCGL